MVIRNFTDPRVLGAACATAERITEMSNTVYKQIVVSVLNGTYQVTMVLDIRIQILVKIF